MTKHRRDARANRPLPRRPLPRRLSLLLANARAALWWERLWPAVWPAVGVLGLFIALALLDILPVLPGWLHALALVLFLAAFGLAVWRGLRRIARPTLAESQQRLERDSGVAHRPLAALDDTLATGAGDAEVNRLWAAHRERMRARLARLRPFLPRAGLARSDRYALRAVVGLLLVIGLAIGGFEAPDRLARALRPQIGSLAAAEPSRLDVWVNPPAYTGSPPLFLDPKAAGGGEPLALPVGSTVLAQVQGGSKTPTLVIGDTSTPFSPVTTDAYKATAALEAGSSLRVEQGSRTLSEWPIAVTPDAAPAIEFLGPPGRTERSALRLEYGAQDDYGIRRAFASVRRLDNPTVEPFELELALPGADLRTAEGQSFHDLTPHLWAGLAVEITLVAEDALGQRGQSDPARTVLPERIFNHPVARALVELRRRLTVNPDEERLPVAGALGEIYERPHHYFDDVVVALALTIAEERLIQQSSPEAIGQVQQLLWDTALHLEDGELSIAERELREIQKALMEALARGADDAEIERLMDELQRALDQFLEALADQMREQLARGEQPQQPMTPSQMLQSQDLRDLIERARELAKTGARDAAQELLSRLQQMLENLRTNPLAQGMSEQAREAMQMIEDMESLMQRQQDLLDRSFERSQRGAPTEGDSSQTREANRADAQSQEELRRELGQMMRQLADSLGEMPRPLGRAEQAMREARDALEGNTSSDAVPPQTRAIDQLQQGLQAMAEQFMQQMGAAGPGGMGQLGAQPGMSQDPLGRRTGNSGMDALEGVELPNQMELRRAREILDELRRRRGERTRPRPELDYIDRLLRQF